MKDEVSPLLASALARLEKASRKNKAKVYSAAVEYLKRSRATRPQVNVGKIGLVTEKGDVVLVPGKVLGSGKISHKVVVGAFGFSKTSTEKILKAGGTVLTLDEMLGKYPSGKGVVLIGG